MTRVSHPDVTVGLDIGTTSVKAVAATADGEVVARARVPHDVLVPEPDLLEQDARAAWHDGVRAAWHEVTASLGAGSRVAGACVGAAVPTLCAVDGAGVPVSRGLLYGDRRGRTEVVGANPAASGELLAMLAWVRSQHPDAAGYWPAQAVGAAALGAAPVVDVAVAAAAYPLFTGTGWSAEEAGARGVRVDQLPEFGPTGSAASSVGDAVLAPGSVDALGELLVSGVGDVGDVLVIAGATLIVWVVVDTWVEVPGLWTIPLHRPGRFCVGGASNAGGLFVSWLHRLFPGVEAASGAGGVPVWRPYLRGERTPLHDVDLRASLHGLDLTHGPAELLRAGYEATGFVVRHHLDLLTAATGVVPRRVVVTGGGTRDAAWLSGLADALGVALDVVATPEGGALGMAWLARMAAGLESSLPDAERWARVGGRTDPDPARVRACGERYQRFRAGVDAGRGAP
jgi:xylulokinase